MQLDIKNTITRIYLFISLIPIVVISGVCHVLDRLLGSGVFSPLPFLMLIRSKFSFIAVRASRLQRNLLQVVAPVDTIDRGWPASDEWRESGFSRQDRGICLLGKACRICPCPDWSLFVEKNCGHNGAGNLFNLILCTIRFRYLVINYFHSPD